MNDEQDERDHEQVGAYVLDALSPGEAASFEAHLQTCASCRAEVAELRKVVDVLPLAIDPVEPPTSLRDRIMAAVEGETNDRPALTAIRGGVPQRVRRPFPVAEGILAVAAVAVIVALGIWNIRLQQRIDSQQAEVAFQQDVTAALREHAVVYPITATSSAPRAAAYMVQPRDGRAAYLIVKDLPSPPRDKVYQLWLMRGTTPLSAATFTYSGRNPEIVHAALPSTGYTLTAVTLEQGPRGSPDGPKGPKVLIGTLRA